MQVNCIANCVHVIFNDFKYASEPQKQIIKLNNKNLHTRFVLHVVTANIRHSHTCLYTS